MFKTAVNFANTQFNQRPVFWIPRKEKISNSATYGNYRNETRAARIQRDNTMKAALVHALRKAFPNATVKTELLKALCEPQDVPPGVSLRDLDLSHAGRWIDGAENIVVGWEKDLGVKFLHSDADWNFAWNTAIALTILDKLLGQGSNSLKSLLSGQRKWVLTPFPGFRSGPNGSCLPTDTSVLLWLDCSNWLAQLLQYNESHPTPSSTSTPALWRLGFDTSRMSDRSAGSNNYVGTTLLGIAHLYYAVLIERLYQIQATRTAAHKSTVMHPDQNPVPPNDLPKELVELLASAEWSVALTAIGQMQRKNPDSFLAGLNFRYAPSPSSEQSVDLQYTLGSDLYARLFESKNSAPKKLFNLFIPADKLEYRPPSDEDERPGFGSVILDPKELDVVGQLQWMDLMVVLKTRNDWFVLRPELVEDKADPRRVHLAAYDELPQALELITDEQAIAKAMVGAKWAIRVDGPGGYVCAALSIEA